MENKTRKGFAEYRKANLTQRYGQAFCNYFQFSGSTIFNAPNSETLESVCERLLDDWQIPQQ